MTCRLSLCGGETQVSYFVAAYVIYQTLLGRHERIAEALSCKTSVRPTLIITLGLRRNQYGWASANVITLDDLFAE